MSYQAIMNSQDLWGLKWIACVPDYVCEVWNE
jgi:hypothetical protein